MSISAVRSRLARRISGSRHRDDSQHHDERGDVPGWVMITVMSAGLVAIITSVAGPQLRTMLRSALTAVGGG